MGTARTTLTLAGMAADRYGTPDNRAPLVLLHGMTFDRRIWQPILDELAQLDPDRLVVAVDLPGHGESPDQPPHSTQRILGLIHEAIGEAGLDRPVLVGHSMSGGLVSLYASQYPVGGVVNVDALPELASFAHLIQSMAPKLHGPGFADVWSMMVQSFRTDLLPVPARQLVADNSRVTPDLALGYWQDMLTTPPHELDAMVEDGLRRVGAAAVPYLLIAGSEPPAMVRDRMSRLAPQAQVEVWPDTGHFPHLAHPRRFAERLLATGGWSRA